PAEDAAARGGEQRGSGGRLRPSGRGEDAREHDPAEDEGRDGTGDGVDGEPGGHTGHGEGPDRLRRCPCRRRARDGEQHLGRGARRAGPGGHHRVHAMTMRSWVTRKPVTMLSQRNRRQPALADSHSASGTERNGAMLAMYGTTSTAAREPGHPTASATSPAAP